MAAPVVMNARIRQAEAACLRIAKRLVAMNERVAQEPAIRSGYVWGKDAAADSVNEALLLRTALAAHMLVAISRAFSPRGQEVAEAAERVKASTDSLFAKFGRGEDYSASAIPSKVHAVGGDQLMAELISLGMGLLKERGEVSDELLVRGTIGAYFGSAFVSLPQSPASGTDMQAEQGRQPQRIRNIAQLRIYNELVSDFKMDDADAMRLTTKLYALFGKINRFTTVSNRIAHLPGIILCIADEKDAKKRETHVAALASLYSASAMRSRLALEGRSDLIEGDPEELRTTFEWTRVRQMNGLKNLVFARLAGVHTPWHYLDAEMGDMADPVHRELMHALPSGGDVVALDKLTADQALSLLNDPCGYAEGDIKVISRNLEETYAGRTTTSKVSELRAQLSREWVDTWNDVAQHANDGYREADEEAEAGASAGGFDRISGSAFIRCTHLRKPLEEAYRKARGGDSPAGTPEPDSDPKDGEEPDAFNVSYKAADLDGTVNAMLAIAMIAENAPVRNMGAMNISPMGQNVDEWARAQVVAETKNAIEAVRELRKEPVGKPFGSTPSDARTAILRLMDSGKLDLVAAKRGGGPVL